MDILKNPIILALFAGAVTYAYLQLTLNEQNKKRLKRGKKKIEINLMIPLVVTVIAWFISYAYFDYTPSTESVIEQDIKNYDMIDKTNRRPAPLPIAPEKGYKFIGDLSSDSSTKSFSLLTNGITIPTKMPDVLLEMF